MKAMVLAAGYGKRLLPFTANTPKALIEVRHQPVIELVFNHIAKVSPDLVVVNTHHLAKQVKGYLANNDWPFPVKVIYEPIILDTGLGIINAQNFLADDKTLVYNVDILTNYDLNRLINLEFDSRTVAYLLCCDEFTDKGLLFNEDEELIGHFGDGKSRLILPSKKPIYQGFCGIHLLGMNFWNFCDFSKYDVGRGEKGVSIIDIYLKAIKDGYKVKRISLENSWWLDVGSVENLAYANSDKFAMKLD
ncbi:MAG: NTP transferase domain-containing protein [SAR324 cluster bacterium]|nr:NTP transferase domain-containing protein [SAR324 cluster bacterium]